MPAPSPDGRTIRFVDIDADRVRLRTAVHGSGRRRRPHRAGSQRADPHPVHPARTTAHRPAWRSPVPARQRRGDGRGCRTRTRMGPWWGTGVPGSSAEARRLLLAELRFQRVHALLEGFLAFLLLLFADRLARRLLGFLGGSPAAPPVPRRPRRADGARSCHPSQRRTCPAARPCPPQSRPGARSRPSAPSSIPTGHRAPRRASRSGNRRRYRRRPLSPPSGTWRWPSLSAPRWPPSGSRAHQRTMRRASRGGQPRCTRRATWCQSMWSA